MNCFRFVSLKYWTQLNDIISSVLFSCELLSICIFEILNTTFKMFLVFPRKLWIAFDLYLWNIEHNYYHLQAIATIVVNCFRFVSLKYWTQQKHPDKKSDRGCELLSICIFEILNTTCYWDIKTQWLLWIAFDLYLWNIEHNSSGVINIMLSVVNCFRFVSLKYWTQPRCCSTIRSACCELLSICIFEILNTTTAQWQLNEAQLWIAFDLYLWNIEHNSLEKD